MTTILLYYAYYLVAILYLASGLLLLIRPQIVQHLIPKLFPLLAHFNRQRIENAVNLILVGIALIIVGDWMVEARFVGFFVALILSAWEVYLSIAFYLKRREILNAIGHFVIHIVIVIFVGWFILSNYSEDINNIQSHVTSISKGLSASVIGSF